MLDNSIDLQSLRAFRTVIREGSFAAAAASLRMPKSTLSKRVADLEADLGVRLIERSTRSLRMTAEGEVLAARADRLLSDADDIRRTLRESGAAPRGHLRIATPMLMGHTMMGTVAAKFRARHPDITLEVLFMDRPPDLLEERFDGAIRFGPLEDTPQVARHLYTTNAAMFAHPSLPGIGNLHHPRDLADMPLIGLAPGWNGTWAPLVGPGETKYELTTPPQLVLGSVLAMRDAAIAGGGIALIPGHLARQGVTEGNLIRVLPDWMTESKSLYFVYPTAQSVTARLRTFIDFMENELCGTEYRCLNYSAAS